MPPDIRGDYAKRWQLTGLQRLPSPPRLTGLSSVCAMDGSSCHAFILDCPNAATGSPGHRVDAAALDALLDVPTSLAPGRGLLSFINSHVQVDYLSLVEYSNAVPSQVDGCTHRRNLPNITAQCFARYKRRYSQFDEVTRLAERIQRDAQTNPNVNVLLYAVKDIPDLGWRREIFEDARLTGRVSLLYAPVAHTAYALNLYRDVSFGPFALGEVELLAGIAPLLRKVHLNALHARRERLNADARLALLDRNLAQRAPGLSQREREVCAALVNGASVHSIGDRMGVAPSTVQTLRKRAYLKLGIHARQPLVQLAG